MQPINRFDSSYLPGLSFALGTRQSRAHDVFWLIRFCSQWNLKFRDSLSAAELEQTVDRLEDTIRELHKDIKHIFY